MNVPLEKARAIRERAGDRCQYCLMHQSLQGATFHIEHINPISKGGETGLANLSPKGNPPALPEDSRSLTAPGVVAESVIRELLKVYERTDDANV